MTPSWTAHYDADGNVVGQRRNDPEPTEPFQISLELLRQASPQWMITDTTHVRILNGDEWERFRIIDRSQQTITVQFDKVPA